MNKFLTYREWLSLTIIGFSCMASILPSVCQLLYGRIPGFWLEEGGLYETSGATACLIAGLLMLYSFKTSLSQKQHLWGFWMFFFAMGCLFIAGEEVSWGQNFFGYEMADGISSTNFQEEFNLHNSMLIQSSNNNLSSILFKLLMFYLIILPMFLMAFPTIKKLVRRMMVPIPSMQIAIIALLAKTADIVNYKVVYGSSFEKDHLHLGEGVESIIEICLLIMAVECFYLTRKQGIRPKTPIKVGRE